MVLWLMRYTENLAIFLCPQLTRVTVQLRTSPRTATRALGKHWIRRFPSSKAGHPPEMSLANPKLQEWGQLFSCKLLILQAQHHPPLSEYSVILKGNKRNVVVYDIKNNSTNVKTTNFIIVTHKLTSLCLMRYIPKVQACTIVDVARISTKKNAFKNL